MPQGNPTLIPVEHDPWANLPQGPVEARQGPMGWRDWAPFVGAALREKLTQGVHRSVGAAALPGNVLQGKVDPSSPEGFAQVQDLAGLLPMAGISLAKPGTVGIFGGRLAKTADLAALAEGQSMAHANAPRGQILSKTGWFQGADGKWRFEIPDTGASMLQTSGENFPLPAQDVISHPALFDAYPEFSYYKTQKLPEHDQASGMFEPKRRFLNMTGGEFAIKDPKDAGIMLHEIQHAVQHKEGFQPGASPDEHILTTLPQYNDYTKLNFVQQLQMAPGKKSSSDLRAKVFNSPWANVRGGVDDILALLEQPPEKISALRERYAKYIPRDTYDAYFKTAGEVEARNVHNRFLLQSKKPPWETEEIAQPYQLLRKSGNKFQFAPVAYDPFGDSK